MVEIITLIGALTTFVTSVTGFVLLFKKASAIHVTVNSQLQRALQRGEQLSNVLSEAGVPIPETPPEAQEHT
jgi:hypothetical protein